MIFKMWKVLSTQKICCFCISSAPFLQNGQASSNKCFFASSFITILVHISFGQALRDISLASEQNVERRLASIKESLEQIYDVRFSFSLNDVALERVFPTEDFLENDKLALVLMKIVTEGYDVPVITVEKEGDFFVLDGHHRSYLCRKLLHETIRSYVLRFPSNYGYRELQKHSLDDLTIMEITVIDDPILRTWQRILSILKHYEAIHSVPFFMRLEQARLECLTPTQFQVNRTQVDAIEAPFVPIVCLRYLGRYYILDGHARALRAMQLNRTFIQTVVLFPEAPIDYGIAKTAKETGLKYIEDIEIVNR